MIIVNSQFRPSNHHIVSCGAIVFTKYMATLYKKRLSLYVGDRGYSIPIMWLYKSLKTISFVAASSQSNLFIKHGYIQEDRKHYTIIRCRSSQYGIMSNDYIPAIYGDIRRILWKIIKVNGNFGLMYDGVHYLCLPSSKCAGIIQWSNQVYVIE